MPSDARDSTRRARCIVARSHCALFVGVTAALVVVGCNWVLKPVEFVASRFQGPREIAQAEMGSTPVDAALLANSDWTPAQLAVGQLLDPAVPRFVNPALEAVFNQPPALRPNLLAAVSLTDPVICANAAIGLARWGDGRALDPLVETVGRSELKMTLREAAAESLGNLTKPSPAFAIRRLIDAHGRYGPSRITEYVPELHADLLRALSRHIDASADSRFEEALRAPGALARQEALSAWGRSTQTELPTAVVELRADPEASVRAAAIGMLLARRHPQALEFAKNSLKDFDADVKLATVAGLGLHGGPDALAALDQVMLHEGEVARAEAVFSFHKLGALEKVWAAGDDKAARVRRSTSQCLALHPSPQTVALARKFVGDTSSDVRRATIAAVESWPVAAAGPVLLAALREPNYETRRLAGEQLATRWPAARDFLPDLPDDRRNAYTAMLEGAWTAEFGPLDSPAAVIATPIVNVTPERLDALEQLLDSARRAPTDGPLSLDIFGADLVDALERLAIERGRPIPDAVYHHVLPSKGAAFAALDLLTSADVNDRRQGADRLAELAAESPLRPLCVVRLVELGVKEDDALVWRGLFEAIANDGGDQAAVLADSGLGHPSPEVRRMACEHFGKHPQPRHAAALTAALADPHEGVVLAAVKALAAPGSLSEPTAIEPLLASRTNELRFAAARALYVNGFPAGAAAWERLAADRDPEVRRRAAAAMGETGDRAFVSTLVRLLDDSSLGVRKTTVDGLIALFGQDVSARQGESLPSLSERINRWRTWCETQATLK